jgi:rRNA biogenesis protein RRP5
LRIGESSGTIKKVSSRCEKLPSAFEKDENIPFLLRPFPPSAQSILNMAPIEKKRKTGPTNDSFARSRKPEDKDGRPSKRPRAEEERPKASTVATKLSKVREEDVAFPRGGASVLTPLEHKQIQIEATQDVLFEQQGAKSSRMEADGENEITSQGVTKSKKKRGKGKADTQAAETEEQAVKIEGLSYKVRAISGS